MIIKSLFSVVGVLVLIFFVIRFLVVKSFLSLKHTVLLSKNGIACIGYIKNIIESSDVDNLKSYRAVIEFNTLASEKIEFTVEDSSMYKPRIGEEVRIKYDKDDPHKHMVNSKKTIIFQWLKFLFALAVLIFLIYQLFNFAQSSHAPAELGKIVKRHHPC
jgi:Protein of unknown function (DUF3592)